MRSKNLILIIVGFVMTCQLNAQPFSAKSEKLYLKAFALVETNPEKAEKLLQKIIDREEHGRAYFKLAEITIARHDTLAAMALYSTAYRLLNVELEYLNSSQGGEFDKVAIENFLSETEKQLALLGQPLHVNNEQISSDNYIINDNNDPGLVSPTQSVSARPDFMLFNNGKPTTFYQYTDKPQEGYRLPNRTELEACLSSLLTTKEGRNQLTNIESVNNIPLRFVSTDLYFSEDNTHFSKGYLIDVNQISLKETDIELGDLSSIILVKTSE